MGSNTDNNDAWKNFTPKANPPGIAAKTATPVDIDDPVALRKLAKSALVEIVQTAPRNVSLVAAIRELLDRIDGKAPQSISMDIADKRLDKSPIDDLLRLAAMMREPMVIAPMPKKLSED